MWHKASADLRVASVSFSTSVLIHLDCTAACVTCARSTIDGVRTTWDRQLGRRRRLCVRCWELADCPAYVEDLGSTDEFEEIDSE